VDLVDAMLSLAAPEPAPTRAPGRLGVRSHLLLLAVLEAARRAQPRRAVASELWSALRRRGAYASGAEELTPLNGAWSALPLLAVAAGTFLWPPSGRRFEAGSVGAYALSPEGWEQLVKTADARVTTLERRR
jgi:hypothetical protein